MIVREIKQHEYSDAEFTEERENTFFLSGGREVRLRCRYHSTQKRTTINEHDYIRLTPAQQRDFQANKANPSFFYCDGDARTRVLAKAAEAAKPKAKPKARRRSGGARTGQGGRGFAWDSELGEFIFQELSSHADYLVKTTPKGLQAYDARSKRRLDRDSLLALRAKLELERGEWAPEPVPGSNCVRLIRRMGVPPDIETSVELGQFT